MATINRPYGGFSYPNLIPGQPPPPQPPMSAPPGAFMGTAPPPVGGMPPAAPPFGQLQPGAFQPMPNAPAHHQQVDPIAELVTQVAAQAFAAALAGLFHGKPRRRP